ncbi:MAG: hypothetical protein HOQ35_05955 [Acidobacteriaceae bacterium]|nr:hypothetical protein [Acidobacteriaceae bacterium]
MLQQWLASGDPRLIAWAAYFAEKTQDHPSMDTMERMVREQLVSPSPGQPYSMYGYDPSRLAISAMLDALIQGGRPVSPGTIRAIEEDFPTHAALLAHQLPLEESRELLRGWFSSERGDWKAQMLARLAAMMLAAQPDPTLVGPIVAKSEEHLTIYLVATNNSGFGLGGSVTCGDSIGVPYPVGWPYVYTYELSENDSSAHGELIRVDDDVIGYKRYVATQGHGSCYFVQPLNAITRHRLIAHFLEISAQEMPWHPEERAKIVWQGQAAYSRQLGRAVEAEQKKLRQTVFQLRERGLLRADQQVMPKFSLDVKCMIKSCPLIQ